MLTTHGNTGASLEAVYGRIDGPIVLIGFGSIGRGMLPLIERHFAFKRKQLIVIDPDAKNRNLLDENGIRFIQESVTTDNYRSLLAPLLKSESDKPGFCINLSVDVSSIDIMRLCREAGSFYIDTAIEPWFGFYFDKTMDHAERTNYAMREKLLEEKRRCPADAMTAVSACGANPGMVSWLVKQALVNIASDLGLDFSEPKCREEWALLMQKSGVKGIHIAERDTQKGIEQKKHGHFMNTWSVDGMISESIQPAELGWGTYEKWLPENARRHESGCKSAIYLLRPGASTRVYSWCPTYGPQYGLLISHTEAIALADYFTVGDKEKPEYRPTCNYAYHPCNAALLSLNEMLGSGGQVQENFQLMEEDEISGGRNELGVLLYGHAKNAYWYGSQLTIDQTRKLAPYQNATGLQVTSGALAGMVWALENPDVGIVEPDDMDFRRCLEVQKPYLGTVKGYYTDWTPLASRSGFFPENIDETDPWQFRNILAS